MPDQHLTGAPGAGADADRRDLERFGDPRADRGRHCFEDDGETSGAFERHGLVHQPPRGGRTEGTKQVTCIAKRADLSYAEFTRIWHGDHKVVAVETQSTFGYVRNEIVRPLTEGAPTGWIAVVEENFPIGALTDPKVFYAAANDAELQRNVKRMMDSCNRFLDMGPLEFTHMSEYWLG